MRSQKISFKTNRRAAENADLFVSKACPVLDGQVAWISECRAQHQYGCTRIHKRELGGRLIAFDHLETGENVSLPAVLLEDNFADVGEGA
jgi:hypothetical protein